MILDGGPCAEGLESTIVSLAGSEPLLLRAGAVPREQIEAVLGRKLAEPRPDAKPQAPGMLASHYAPHARLRLNAPAPKPGEAFLGFGSGSGNGDGETRLNLSESGNLREAAANLFAYLRLLDRKDVDLIAVAPIPEEGLGEAINDRLRRAAAPRSSTRT